MATEEVPLMGRDGINDPLPEIENEQLFRKIVQDNEKVMVVFNIR